jgi:hypothetical protein
MGIDSRTRQGTESYLFGGLNTSASKLNVKSGEAQDCLNIDVTPGGGFTRRSGCTELSDLGAACQHFTMFYDNKGDECFFAIAGDAFYMSRDAVTWSSVSGPSITYTGATPIISSAINGFLLIANADFEPMVYSPLDSLDVRTIREASLIESPTNFRVTGVGNSLLATTDSQYAVSAFTARGETLAVTYNRATAGPPTLYVPDATNPYVITWTPVDGAAGYKVYRRGSSATWASPGGGAVNWVLVDTVYGEDSDSTTDTDGAGLPIQEALPISATITAWRTPTDWERNGYPEGVAIMARGRDQRVLFWRRDRLWLSGSNDHLEYLDTTDAFDVAVIGGMNNKVRAVCTLFDYTVVFTETNFFLYTGSSGTDFGLQKILNTGCVSHYSIVYAGDEAYVWSQFGPTAISRVLAGADVESDDLSRKARAVVGESTRSTWPHIIGYHDARAQRIVWSWTPTGGASNNKQLVFNYELQAWTRYEGWAIKNVVVTEDRRVIAAFEDGKINELHVGNTDNGVAIPWNWTSGDSDLRSDMRKSMPCLDLHVDKSDGSFTFTTELTWDFNSKASQTFTLTESTVNGRTVVESESTAVTHYQLRPVGAYRQFRIKFSGSSSGAAPTIIGMRPDMRVLGIR